MQSHADDAMDALPDGGDLDVGSYLQELSGACGLYVVTYGCVDAVGNMATSTQHIFVRDTIDPDIYTGYYDLLSTMSGTGGGLFLGVVCVAFAVGVVATRKRREYMPL